MLSRRQAVGYLFLTVLLWSTGGLLIKLLPWNALAIMGARSTITAIVIYAWIRHPHFTWSRPQIGGAIALAITQALFIASTQMTTAANAIFLQYTAPVFVAIFGGWYLKEHTRPVDWYAMGAVFVGMFIFLYDGLTAGGLLGCVFAILSGISMAWMLLFVRKQKDGSPVETILLGNLLSAIVGLPFVLWEIGWGTPLGTQGIGIILFLGIFQLAIPYILFAQASRVLSAVETALILMLEPILNPIWVFLVIDEQPSQYALLGGLIVILTVTFMAINTVRQPKLKPQPVTIGDGFV